MRLAFLVADPWLNLDLLEEKPPYLVTDVVIDLVKMEWSEVGREWRKPTPIGQFREDGRVVARTVLAIVDREQLDQLAAVIRSLRPVTL